MDKAQIIQSLDNEIKRLQQARELLSRESRGRATPGRYGPRHMSAEARARIAAAQRARWARVKAGQKNAVASVSQVKASVKRRTHRMSAEGRARIAAAQKARWAKLKTKKK